MPAVDVHDISPSMDDAGAGLILIVTEGDGDGTAVYAVTTVYGSSSS